MKRMAALLAGMTVWTGTVAAHAVDSSFLTFNGFFPIQRFLFVGQMIESPLCRFRTVMQNDGNLVTYNNQNRPIWHLGFEGTPGPDGSYAAMQLDANLVVYDTFDSPYWATNTAGAAMTGRLVQQDDGNLVIYNSAGQALWASFPEPVTFFSGPCHTARHTDIIWGFDAPGGDLTNFFIPQNLASWCGDSCARDPARCKAWTWVPPNVPGITGSQSRCFLKSSQPALGARSGFVSGRIVVGSS